MCLVHNNKLRTLVCSNASQLRDGNAQAVKLENRVGIRLEYIMLLNLPIILSSNFFKPIIPIFYSFLFPFILFHRSSRIKLLTITNYNTPSIILYFLVFMVYSHTSTVLKIVTFIAC